MDVVTTLDGAKMIALAHRAKSDNGKKAKANKDKFLKYFGATECVATLPGIPEENKRHYPDGKRAPSNFINRCKFVE